MNVVGMNYRPEIDGLRSIAVLSVIIHHAGFGILSGGFLGVDIFFVISGYLITSIIWKDVQAGQFSIARFYERRIRRLIPVLLLVLIATIPFAWVWMVPWQFEEYAASMVATLLFVSNVYFWQNSDYFAPTAEHKPLLHTWSLSVEEQFYLIFPLILIMLARRGPAVTIWMIFALSVGSLILAQLASSRFAQASFYLTPTRAWELGIGALLAFIRVSPSLRLANVLSVAGLGMVLGSLFLFTKGTQHPSVWTVLPVLGTALILYCGTRETWVGRALSLRGPVFFGMISYSLYLWHQPVFAFARIRFPEADLLLVRLGLIALSVMLAVASYYLVENPLRGRSRHTIPFWKIGWSSLAFGSALTFFGAWSVFEISNGRYQFQDIHDKPALQDLTTLGPLRASLEENPILAEEFNNSEHPIRISVMGDSHAGGFTLFAYQHRDSFGSPPFIIDSFFAGCMVHADISNAEAHAFDCVKQKVSVESNGKSQSATHVVLSLLWTKYAENRPKLYANLNGAVRAISEAGKVPVISTGGLEAKPNPPFLIWSLFRKGELTRETAARTLYENQLDSVAEVNAWLRSYAKENDVALIDRYSVMCDAQNEACHALTPDREPIYLDYTHLTLAGAKYIGALADQLGMFELFNAPSAGEGTR